VVGALEGIAAAFEAGEGLAGVLEGFAEETVGEGFMGAPAVVVVGDFEELGFPKLGFGLAQAAEGPFGIDEDIDEGTLGGGLGAVIVEVLSGERGEGIGVLAADDLGLGVDAGFQGILGRDGLARRGRLGTDVDSVRCRLYRSLLRPVRSPDPGSCEARYRVVTIQQVRRGAS